MQTALWHQQHMPETLISHLNNVCDYWAHVQPINQPMSDASVAGWYTCHHCLLILESAVPQIALHKSTSWPIQVKNQCRFNPGQSDRSERVIRELSSAKHVLTPNTSNVTAWSVSLSVKLWRSTYPSSVSFARGGLHGPVSYNKYATSS